MTKVATPLAEIRKTRFAKRIIRRGAALTERAECWGAETTDGEWVFDRADEPGTPWTVVHRPTETAVDLYVSTLTDCRAYVASGQALADLELLQAHDRGEHDHQRNPACGRC